MDFAGSINRETDKAMVASMSTFSAVLMRGWFLLASMATMAGEITKQTNKLLGASMATFSGSMMRGWVMTASMATMAATITKQTSHILESASMATFDVVFDAIKTAVIAFSASMQTFSGTLTKLTKKFFNAD